MNESYLILGDGDFTYALDLCRYFSLSLNTTESNLCNDTKDSSNPMDSPELRIVCTGIDTLQELREKYKDIDYTLREIRSQSRGNATQCDDMTASCCSPTNKNGSFKRPRIQGSEHARAMNENPIQTKEFSTKSCFINISIHHGVNAIQPWDNQSQLIYESENLVQLGPDPPLPSCKFDNVIFNHPHIGTEDAALHSLFLCHFFQTCVQSWLSTRGIIHLTLVKGQCERWKCLSSAKQFNLKLIHRIPFASPLQKDGSRYQHRRHQSGKSFASRAKGGSETLVFSFESSDEIEKNYGINQLRTMKCLPWQRKLHSEKVETTEDSCKEKSFSCTECGKSFREERSLKNHMKAVHSENFNQVPADMKKPLICSLCPRQPNMEPRTFPNSDALKAHKVAKHSGIHTSVLPDWCKQATTKRSGSDEKCSVCNLAFLSSDEKVNHYLDFIPKIVRSENCSSKSAQIVFECMFCEKQFREKRAKMQHENFCSKRPT